MIQSLHSMKNQTKPSSFIASFSSILQNKEFEEIVKLDQSKGKIYIFDRQKFESEILPTFFRHNKLTSFIRQLNLYGFKKIKNASFLCYTHPQLAKGQQIVNIISKKHLRKEQSQHHGYQESPRNVQLKGDQRCYNRQRPQPSNGYEPLPHNHGYPTIYQPYHYQFCPPPQPTLPYYSSMCPFPQPYAPPGCHQHPTLYIDDPYRSSRE